MSQLKIIVCGNAETLNCEADEAADYVSACVALECEGIEIESDDRFKHWNGGPGASTGGAYVRLEDYGRVRDFDDCRKAIGFLLSGGGGTEQTHVDPPDHWPSADEIEAAFDLLDEVLSVEVASEATGT